MSLSFCSGGNSSSISLFYFLLETIVKNRIFGFWIFGRLYYLRRWFVRFRFPSPPIHMKSTDLSPALAVALVLLSIATLTWGQTSPSGHFCAESEDCNSGLCEGEKCCHKSVANDHTRNCTECDDSGQCTEYSAFLKDSPLITLLKWGAGVIGGIIFGAIVKAFCCKGPLCEKNKEKKGKTSVHVSPSAAGT